MNASAVGELMGSVAGSGVSFGLGCEGCGGFCCGLEFGGG